MTRQELFDRYLDDTLDDAGTAELGQLLGEDPEFAAEFAKNLLETGLFVQVGTELQRVDAPAAEAPAPPEEHHPHLITGDTGQGLPRSLLPHQPPPAPVAAIHPTQSAPPPPPAGVVHPPQAAAPPPPAGVVPAPAPAGQPPVAGYVPPHPVAGVVPSVPNQPLGPEHHAQPVLKSAQSGSPIVPIIIGILVVGVGVAVVLGLNKKDPPPPASDPAVAQVNAVEGKLSLTRGVANQDAAAGSDLMAGDLITVEIGSARVGFIAEQTFLHLRTGCEVRFEDKNGGKDLRLTRGELTAEVAPQALGKELVIRTSQASVKVIGTKVTVRAGSGDTLVEVAEGKVRVERNADGVAVEVGKGSYAVVEDGELLDAWELVAGVNLNGSEVEIGGNTWLSQSDAESKGLKVVVEGGSPVGKKAQTEPLGFLPDSGTRSLLMSSVSARGDRLSLSQTVPNGRYQVFLWVMEDEGDEVRAFRLNLEEKLVEEDLGAKQLKGEWTRLGPYKATVEDGSLDFLLSPDQKREKRDPHLAGLAIYRVAGGGAEPTEEAPEEEPEEGSEEAPEEEGAPE